MMTVFSVVVFLSAFTTAAGVIGSSVAPQWRRIARLATGEVEQPFALPATLTYAESQIAVRHWATAQAPASRLREAA